MSEKAYKEFCGDMCRNFDKPWDKVGAKLGFAYEFLSWIPDHAWKQMVPIAMRKWEKWPSNWSKHVQELYRELPHENKPITYERIEDFRFPLNLMWQAFWILHKQGDVLFNSFCESHHMPANDRERVRNKHRVISSGESRRYNIPEIGIRVSPKTNRPDFLPYKDDIYFKPFREPGEEG